MQTKTKLSTKQKVAIAVGAVAIAAALAAAGLSGMHLRDGKGGNPPVSAPKIITPMKKIVPGVRITPPKTAPKPIIRPTPKK
ncbi:MAG: hypothetical protein V1928_02010 [Parcubacteria group bacterium]